MTDDLAARIRIAERLERERDAYRHEHPNAAMDYALRSAAHEARAGRDGELKFLSQSGIRTAEETWMEFNVERTIRVKRGQKATDAAIAEALGVGTRTIRRWRQSWPMAGLPDPVRISRRRGRPRTIDIPPARVGASNDAVGQERSGVVPSEAIPRPGPRPMVDSADVQESRDRLLAADKPSGERSIARDLGVSRGAVRYAMGKDR